MGYDYQSEKAALFTEENQAQFLKVRDVANDLIAKSGAVMMGELVEVNYGSCAGQHRVFRKPWR